MLTKRAKIAHDLREAIAQGTYAPGDTLPPLPELMEQYGVARETVRQAVSSLANEGLVTPKPGLGTVVRDLAAVNLDSSLADPHPTWATTAGDDAKIEVLTAELVAADPEITRRLATSGDVAHRVKNYYAGRSVALTHEQWIPGRLAAAILDQSGYDLARSTDVEPTDLYTLMKRSGHRPSETTETVTTRMPTPDEQELTNSPAGVPMLCTLRVTRDRDGVVLETSDFAGPADKTSQTYTVAIPQ